MTQEQEVKALYKPPFRHERGYIWDAEGNRVAGRDCDGYLSGGRRISLMPDSSQLQDAVGDLIAKALTEYWGKPCALADHIEDKLNMVQAVCDAMNYGTGVTNGGKHVELKDFYKEGHMAEQEPVAAVTLGRTCDFEQLNALYALPDGRHLLYTTPPKTTWQPIATAPKDNKRPLYFGSFEDGELVDLHFEGYWSDSEERWRYGSGYAAHPTHWAYQDEPIPQVSRYKALLAERDDLRTRMIAAFNDAQVARKFAASLEAEVASQRSANAALTAMAQVPPGFKLVPVEPTNNMKSAVSQLFCKNPEATQSDYYRAMLNAAPQPPKDEK